MEDVKCLYGSGLQKFLESKKYHKARQKYLESKQDFSKPKSDKQLDKILGIDVDQIELSCYNGVDGTY